jgi:hypothetical protein
MHMSDASSAVKNLRERLAGAGEDHLGRALSDLLDNPLLTGTIGRAFDARERAAQAQELAMGVLNIPSAADIERLTRRLRSVSQRLEGIEDGVHRLDRALASHGVAPAEIGQRLSQIEEQLGALTRKLGQASSSPSSSSSSSPSASAGASPKAGGATKPAAAERSSAAKRSAAKRSAASKPAKRRTARAPRAADSSTKRG